VNLKYFKSTRTDFAVTRLTCILQARVSNLDYDYHDRCFVVFLIPPMQILIYYL
jgi:hypothetical protein